jgi:hypothetical protein
MPALKELDLTALNAEYKNMKKVSVRPRRRSAGAPARARA